jgi:hypothetical protein
MDTEGGAAFIRNRPHQVVSRGRIVGDNQRLGRGPHGHEKIPRRANPIGGASCANNLAGAARVSNRCGLTNRHQNAAPLHV